MSQGSPHTRSAPMAVAEVAPASSTSHDTQPDANAVSHLLSDLNRLLAFVGVGRAASHARKSLAEVVFDLMWGITQVMLVVVVLVLTGVLFKNPRNSGVSEWKACSSPLGAWASLWVARVLLASGLSYWKFCRNHFLFGTEPSLQTGNNTASHENNTGTPSRAPRPLSHSNLYSRLKLLSSMITMGWLFSAHVLAYTSIHTCRHTSPHLWWLIFGIMCVGYLPILEVVVWGFVVLIITPISSVIWNIMLICLRRHPMQNSSVIAPNVGKISQASVDQIPLCIYVPSPGSEDSEQETGLQTPHIYPPQRSDEKPVRTLVGFLKDHLSFGFARKRAQEKVLDIEAGDTGSPSPSWFDKWEPRDYPFVAIDKNRATCAVCLTEFEEPSRKENKKVEAKKEGFPHSTEAENMGTDNVNANATLSRFRDPSTSGAGVLKSAPILSIPQNDEGDDLKLSSASEDPQPLRVLGCGHAFHKSCVDPWLTSSSGRCPTCQAAAAPRCSK